MQFMHPPQKGCSVFHLYQIRSSLQNKIKCERRRNQKPFRLYLYFPFLNPFQNLLCTLNIHQIFHYFSSCFSKNRKLITYLLYCNKQEPRMHLLFPNTLFSSLITPK